MSSSMASPLRCELQIMQPLVKVHHLHRCGQWGWHWRQVGRRALNKPSRFAESLGRLGRVVKGGSLNL
eukprot:3839378-Amphidinium_carterae.1